MLVAPERVGTMELERLRRKRLGGKMTEEDLLLGADQILQARRSVGKLAGLPEAHRPGSLADGYRMQQVAAERWGDEVVGWKVGATSQEVQKLFAIGEPVYGPVFKESVFRSPARLKAIAFQHLMLESEFAFTFRESLPARTAPYSRADVLAAVDAVCPAIEIISPRFKRLTIDHIPQLVADFCGNGAAVVGTPCRDWRFLDLVSHAVGLSIDGVLRQQGSGAVVLGDPVNVLEWLVNALRVRGLAILPGQFVMTGTMTGIHTPKPGEVAVADFGDLGTVEVAFD
jgi:2-keto-4-pentenoate hydratase